MATNGAVKNYKFGTKNNWRRQLWNHIVALLKEMHVKPGDAKVLYLAGRDDLDRVEAKRRGFKDWNLFAVENDVRTLRALRDKGVIAIRGDFSEVLYCWPQHLDVVIADFCCGYHKKTVMKFIEAVLHSRGTPRSILALNMLRGRDRDYMEVKKEFRLDLMVATWGHILDKRKEMGLSVTYKERLDQYQKARAISNNLALSRPYCVVSKIWWWLSSEFGAYHMGKMFDVCSAMGKHIHYRSDCGQVFDTHIHPYAPVDKQGKWCFVYFANGQLATSDLTRTRRRISAALAQSTSWQRYGNKAGKTA